MSIVKAKESDNNNMMYLYNILKSSCTDYDYLDINTFLECRNSIYYCNKYNNIIGMIGCRRIDMKKANIKELSYYCTPYQILYSIEFLHYDDNRSKHNIASNEFMELIKECIADKNEAFIVYRTTCPNSGKSYWHNELIKVGFVLYSYDVKKKQYTYIKEPTTNSTK